MAEDETSQLPRNISFSSGRPYIKDGGLVAPGARNFIKFLFFDPCARPFYAYALTLAPALLEAFLSVVVITASDVIRDRARKIAPAGAIAPFGNPKRKAGSTARKGQKNNFSTSQKGLAHLLRWTQPIENVGLALLLYGAADNFFMRWQSLIMAVSPCADAIGTFQRSAFDVSWNMLFAGGAANMPDLLQNSAAWLTTPFQVGLPPGQYIFMFSAKLSPEFPASYPAGIQVFHPGLAGTKISQSGLQQVETGQITSYVVSKTFIVTGFSGTTLGWQTYGSTVPVGVRCVEAHIAVSRLS